MRSPTPPAKSKYSGTSIPRSTSPKKSFVRFDNSRFIKTVSGPSNLFVCVLVILSMCISGLVVTEIQPLPFCYDNFYIEKCARCPDFATCFNGYPECLAPYKNVLNFCVLPDSDEEKALEIVPKLRGLTAKEVDKVIHSLNSSDYIIKLAKEYTKKENIGGFNSKASYLYLVLAIIAWIITTYIILLQNRYKKEHKFIVQAYEYLEEIPPSKVTINHVLKHLNINVDKAAKRRILKELIKVPQFDVDLKAETIFRRI